MINLSLHKIFVSSMLVLSLTNISVFASAQTLEAPAETHKNDIRRMYNGSVNSYEDLQDKIEQERYKKHVKDLKNKIKRYYDVAVILEKQGKYEQAADCYKKVLSLTNDPELRGYIETKNTELKELAKESKIYAHKQVSEAKLREQEKQRLKKIQLKDEISKMRNRIQ